MNKTDSIILKGVAICFMLFLHLFNQKGNMGLCTNFLYIGGTPLVFLLSKFTHICVPMYLFLSGYGLYLSFEEKKNKESWKRILSLWLNYIIILCIFIGIGAFIAPEKYPGSFSEIILNITAWSNSYNGEWWFLFPYFVLVLLSVPFFKLFNKFNSWIVFLLLSTIYFITYLTLYYNKTYLYSHYIVYKLVVVLNCLFSFGLGALFAKENLFAKVKRHLFIYPIAVIILMIVIRIILPVAIFNPLFACAFIVCFTMIKRHNVVDRILELLGKHSTNIWLIQSFIYSYRFTV